MAKRRRSGPSLKIIGLIIVFILLIIAAILGVRVAQVTRQALEEARTTPTAVPQMGNVLSVTPDPSLPTQEPLLRSGTQGDQVVALQERLQELGYYQGEIDGQFGAGTKEAVVLFQQTHSLDADGVVGPATKELLYSNQAIKYVFTPSPTPTYNAATATPLP